MRLRKQAKIWLGNSPYLCQIIDCRRPWNAEIKARHDELSATTFATTPATTDVKSIGQRSFSSVAHSSSGLGHRPLKAEITGSNPVCATKKSWDNCGVFPDDPTIDLFQ